MNTISLILRLGLAFSFLYPAISAFFNPFAWIGYFPQFAHALIPNDAFLLHSFGIVEIIIALWLLSGRRVFYPSIAAAVLLFLIVVFNFSQMDVVFRDLSIFAMAVALALLHKPSPSA
ncbi:MAG: hypothetical protein HYT27_03505 [Parcubacteria group bacterium]|nr:hypothetical protein [Parcubacteria group bacterium]